MGCGGALPLILLGRHVDLIICHRGMVCHIYTYSLVDWKLADRSYIGFEMGIIGSNASMQWYRKEKRLMAYNMTTLLPCNADDGQQNSISVIEILFTWQNHHHMS